MILIDLSRDIEHKMQVLPNHPQVIVTTFSTHDEIRHADGYPFSSAEEIGPTARRATGCGDPHRRRSALHSLTRGVGNGRRLRGASSPWPIWHACYARETDGRTC